MAEVEDARCHCHLSVVRLQKPTGECEYLQHLVRPEARVGTCLTLIERYVLGLEGSAPKSTMWRASDNDRR